MNLGQCLTLTGYGKVGISIGIGVQVAAISAPPAGRYHVWLLCRHAIDDGLRLKVNGSIWTTLSGPGLTQIDTEKMTVNLDGINDIILETNAATGLTGLASGTIFAQRICDHLSEHNC